MGSRRIVAFDDTAAIVATSRSNRSFNSLSWRRVLMSVQLFRRAQRLKLSTTNQFLS
jgi:hypothetical protein